ncbi:MAG: hypothetical protein KBE38_15205 [Ignavibacterium sp.]|nr:hypothetical protein [Ignavibacterium sp.]
MGMTKTKTFKLTGNEWLEVFVEKNGIKYCIQFTEKHLNVVRDWDRDEKTKTLLHTKLSPQ